MRSALTLEVVEPMASTMAPAAATRPAHERRNLQPPPPRDDMEQTRKRLRRANAHATRLARWALTEAGSRKAVAAARGVSPSTQSHECTDRVHPGLATVLELAIVLNGSPGTNARALRDAIDEAIELSEIVTADDETVIERGVYLLQEEHRRDFIEDTVSLVDPRRHAEALRGHAAIAAELAAILDECEERGLDLYDAYKRRVIS